MNGFRLYLRYAGISIRSQMQYRASFVMMAAGHGLITGVEFLGLWALFARFGSLQEWSLPEVALLYGMISIAFAIAEAVPRGFDTFHFQVKSGDFDRLLVRPRSTALQVGATSIQLMRIGRLTQGFAVLLYGAWALDVGWTVGGVALLIAAIAGGACLFSGLFILQATLAFWTIESIEIVNCLTYGGIETAQYPIAIYRGLSGFPNAILGPFGVLRG